jgi:hypothetical protein
VKHCGFGKRQRTAVRMAECEPGEVAEIDFGLLALVPDPERGGRRVAWALVVVLVHSRHQYVHVANKPAIEEWIPLFDDLAMCQSTTSGTQ